MKLRFFILSVSMLIAAITSGQTVLISLTGDGGFETGNTFASNNWTVVNHSTNKWEVGTAAINGGTYGAYISNDGGTTNVYTNNSSQTSHFYRDVTFSSGASSQLKFDWKSNGESGYDRILVYMAPTSVTPVAGTPASSSTTLTGATLIGGPYNSQTTWQSVTISLGTTYAGDTYRLIFTWQNDASVGTNPPGALDNISLIEYPPLTGVKTIKTSGGDYSNFIDAINALNSIGVGTGGVTFDIDAGFTSTELCPVITATGTSSNPILFKKSGAGSNPLITAGTGTGTTDGIIRISGGDYITFDGIDLAENAGNSTTTTQMEYGFYIYNASSSNGAQYVTIKNSKITLNRANTATRAVYQNVATSPTNATGANSYNQFQDLTIENSYQGIYVSGNATYPDLNLEISNCIVGANSANDIGNGSSTLNGIRMTSVKDASVFGNLVRNVTVTGSVAVYGIYLESIQGANNIYNNQVQNIKSTSTSTSSIVYGIRADINSSQTCNIYNNFISEITHGATSASSTQVIRGLAVGVSGTGTANVFYNSIRIEENQYPSSTAFYIGSNGTVNLKNNIFSNFSTAGTTSFRYSIFKASGSTLNNSNYNDFFITTSGTNNHLGSYNGTNYNTLANWQTITGKDGNSKNVDPLFVSSTNLHSTSTELNGAGVTISTTNGDALNITTDIDEESRSDPPDIGADEFAVNDQTSIAEAPATQVNSTSVSSTATTSEAAVEVFRFKITDSGSGDELPTKVTNIRITNANPTNGANWTTNISGVKLNDGTSDIPVGNPTISSSQIDIPISIGNLDVADNSSKTITLSVYLSNTGIEDGNKLQFTIPATGHGFTADASGSMFNSSFGSAITSNEHTITVEATKLLISGTPSSVLVNSGFSGTVTATDENGNHDLDNTTSVTISINTGSGDITSASGLTQNLVGGTRTWTDLMYDATGDFTLKAEGGALTQGVSSTINSINEIIIGAGTSAAVWPFSVLSAYTRNAALYTQAEIGAFLTIERLGWQINNAYTTNVPVKIYLKKTSSSTITAANWTNLTTGATLVYDGTVQFTPSGWFTIDLTSTFNYDSDNLLVLTEANYGSSTSNSSSFRYTSVTSCNANISGSSPPTGNLSVGNNRPNLRIAANIDMQYTSSASTQAVTSTVNAGTTNQQIIGIEVVTQGNLNPLSITKIVLNANGTSDVSDICNAKVWYSGTSSSFSTANQYGSTVASPTTTDFEVNGTQQLAEGTNYFWVTYDVNSTAVRNNVVDAECTGLTISSSDQTPTVTAPSGTRTIDNKWVTSVTGIQASTAAVVRSEVDKEVLRINIAVTGPSTGSLFLNSFQASYTGTNAIDIQTNGVKLYHTTSTSFSTSNQIGTSQSISGGLISFSSLNFQMPTGTSYFWLAFDIDANATLYNVVDAKVVIDDIDVGGSNFPSSDIDPAGTRTIRGPLTGTFSVGTGGFFTSFTNANGLFAEINTYGLSGNVTAEVISNINDEAGSNWLNQWSETGVGNYTLTIRPNAATTRQVISSSYVFYINGADRVTVDGNFSGEGKYLLLRTTSTSQPTIRFTNNASYNTLTNCTIEGTTTVTSNGVVEFYSGLNTNNVVSNCNVRDRSDASARPANALYFNSSSSSDNSISNCNIFNFTDYGVYVSGATNTMLSGNTIYMSSASSKTTVGGIYLADGSATGKTTIERNNLYGLSGSSSATVRGIYYIGATGINMQADILNNTISLSPTTTGNVYGIDFNGYAANSCNVFYNSVYIGGSPTSGTSSTYAFLKRASATTLDIRNNLFLNARSNSGATGKHYSIGLTNTTQTSLVINYNDYFTNGTGGILGVYSITDKTTLLSWQQSTTQDANSYNTNPNFTSTTNLRPTAGSYLIGVHLTGFTTDFDSNTRSNPPDIGAYEGSEAGRWLGTTSDDWNTITNWDNSALPGSDDNIVISSWAGYQPVIYHIPSSPAVCNNLTINSGASLTINAGKALTVNGTITNNEGNDGLIIKSDATGTGSFIHYTAEIPGTFERYMNNADWSTWKDGWHFLSSPVSGHTISPAFTADPAVGYDFYLWNEPTNEWVNFKNQSGGPGIEPYFDIANGSNTFTLGRGYMAAYDEAATKSFTGIFNVNDVEVSGLMISNPENSASWHLLGNPFCTALVWDGTEDWDLSNIAGVAKIWNEVNQSYTDITSSPSMVIPPTNGFMVQVIDEVGGSLTLPAFKRLHNAQDFYKTEIQSFKLIASSQAESNSQESVIIFNPQSTSDYDIMYDGTFLAGHAPSFYSMAGNYKLSTNSLPVLSEDMEIPFGFSKNSGEHFSITASGIETIAGKPYLEDLKTGVIHDFSMNPVYNFTSSEGDSPIRFILKFGSVGVEESESFEKLKIWSNEKTIYLQSTDNADGLVFIYNISGQRLYSSSMHFESLQTIQLNFPKGWYAIQVISEGIVTNKKVIIW